LAGIQAEITKIPKRRESDNKVKNVNEAIESVLQPGRYALSICIVQGTMGAPNENKEGEPIDNGYRFFQEFEPVGRVGYSIWLYELSESDILASKTWGGIYRDYLERGLQDQK
jgi:hypothetical protein